MTPNAWALFDKTKSQYLTTGSSPFYGHSSSPAEAHLYFSDQVAFRQAQILLEKFANSKHHYNVKDIELQIVPLVVQTLKAEDVKRVNKKRKEGFAIWVEILTDYMQTPYTGFWKRPAWVTRGHAELGQRTLKSDAQKADVWKDEDAAQEWAKAVEKGTRDSYARSATQGVARLRHFSVVVKAIK